MLKIIPNKKNIGAEIIVNLKNITNKDIFKIKEFFQPFKKIRSIKLSYVFIKFVYLVSECK